MAEQLEGVPLDIFQEPIREALQEYQEIAGNGMLFDLDEVGKLVLTPDKPNSARSATVVKLHGEQVSTLYVIAFKHRDGTGDEANGHKLLDLMIHSSYPYATKVVPRNKTGVHSEAHLTVATLAMDDAHADPIKFAGRFDLLGIVQSTEEFDFVRRIGILGYVETQEKYLPKATITVRSKGSERFGDPHAIYSSVPNTIQVCAFLALSDDMQKRFPYVIADLRPQMPATI